MTPEQVVNELAQKFCGYSVAGILSLFGGGASYVYDTVKKGKKFNIALFLANLFLAFFVGNVVGEFIPHELHYRDGLIMICGFSTWPVLDLLQDRGLALIKKHFL